MTDTPPPILPSSEDDPRRTATSGPSWRDVGRDLHRAMLFLTRLPLPPVADWPDGVLARAMRVFPVAGAVVGLIAGAVFLIASWVVPPLVAAMTALLIQVLITGALHEDGLADSADGLGARGGRERRLEVMRDSRSGTYGVVALIFSVGLRAAALAEAPSGWAGLGAMIAAAGWSRAMIPLSMQVMAPARSDGLGAGAGRPDAGVAAIAAALGVVALLMGLGGWAGIAFVVSLAAMAVVVATARRLLGGFTGDVLGAVQQMSEIGVWLAAAAIWRMA